MAYLLTVYFEARDEKAARQFVEEMTESGVTALIRAEAGCIRYDFYFDAEDPKKILLFEEWESEAHQQIHITQPHMDTMRAIKGKYVVSSQLIAL